MTSDYEDIDEDEFRQEAYGMWDLDELRQVERHLLRRHFRPIETVELPEKDQQ